MNVGRGKGWAILGLGDADRPPGAHDVADLLGMTDTSAVLVVLRAAESWSPQPVDMPRSTIAVRVRGRVMLEFDDGSCHLLGEDREVAASDAAIESVVNVDETSAELLVMAR